jgi:hypothetical protein
VPDDRSSHDVEDHPSDGGRHEERGLRRAAASMEQVRHDTDEREQERGLTERREESCQRDRGSVAEEAIDRERPAQPVIGVTVSETAVEIDEKAVGHHLLHDDGESDQRDRRADELRSTSH